MGLLSLRYTIDPSRLATFAAAVKANAKQQRIVAVHRRTALFQTRDGFHVTGETSGGILHVTLNGKPLFTCVHEHCWSLVCMCIRINCYL